MRAMSQAIIITLLLLLFTTLPLLPALPALPDPDPIQTQTQTLPQTATPIATIPAFPEQSEATACPLDLPDDLFHGIKSACSGRINRNKCCPVLAAYIYSAYSRTALHAVAAKPPQQQTEMPVLPDDSETCVDSLEKALGNKGIVLNKPNETCDVVYCYCGIRLHPFTCPEAFSVSSKGKVVGNAAVRKLEKECAGHGGYGGCSNCLNSLYLLNEEKAGKTNRSERKSKMHSEDCELMGLTWLLHKNRATYINTVSAVLRALMMREDNSGAAVCRLNVDGMPLAVDSSQINSQSSSTDLGIKEPYQYLTLFSLLLISILLLLSRY